MIGQSFEERKFREQAYPQFFFSSGPTQLAKPVSRPNRIIRFASSFRRSLHVDDTLGWRFCSISFFKEALHLWSRKLVEHHRPKQQRRRENKDEDGKEPKERKRKRENCG